MRTTPLQIVTNGDMSQPTINSLPVTLDQVFIYSIQAIWTGTPTGTLKLQISDDVGPGLSGAIPTNWSDYTGSSQSIAGASGNFLWNVTYTGCRWVRLVYSGASGSGTLTANYNGKGF